MRVAVLAHEKFPDRAKTAIGVLRYADYDVAAVIDRETAGGRVSDHVSDVQDAPIVDTMSAVDAVDALLIGVAPIGGGFDPSWRDDVRTAIGRGCDVIAGLHYFISEDEEFAQLAAEHDVELRDVRRPPDDLTVSEGVARDLDVHIIETVGTDCSVGKMTVTMELVDALKAAGVDAAAIPTGQTGIMIEGWGIAVDRTISDFTAGATERMIQEKAEEHDVLVVEGQGSITHPAYSAVTLGLLHGAMPDQLVLCHEAGRGVIHGYESFPLVSLEQARDLYVTLAEPVAPTSVTGLALNTSDLDMQAATEACEDASRRLDVPCVDPIRHNIEPLVSELIP